MYLLHEHGQPPPGGIHDIRRISGPLLDRIDIHIEVPRVEYEKLSDDRLGEPSAAIQARVEAARERQRQGFQDTSLLSNADMGPAEVREFCPADDAGKSLLRAAMQQLHMSARAYHRILKLARTIADLAGSGGSRQRIWRRRFSPASKTSMTPQTATVKKFQT
jgi:predicted ATPase with chaperone activity